MFGLPKFSANVLNQFDPPAWVDHHLQYVPPSHSFTVLKPEIKTLPLYTFELSTSYSTLELDPFRMVGRYERRCR